MRNVSLGWWDPVAEIFPEATVVRTMAVVPSTASDRLRIYPRVMGNLLLKFAVPIMADTVVVRREDGGIDGVGVSTQDAGSPPNRLRGPGHPTLRSSDLHMSRIVSHRR
jgi:hypothetical protein